MSGDARIAPTAHYTAHVWHRLGLPHAELFRTRRGRRLFWGFRIAGEWIAVVARRVPSMTQVLRMRHVVIEDRLVAIDPDRLVEIGAGLSRRGFTWALDRGVPTWEIDLPAVAELKRRLLRERAPELLARAEPNWHLEARDVLDPSFGPWLADVLRGAQRPAVVAEGVMLYLGEDERRALLAAVASAMPSGTMLLDVRDRALGKRVAVAERVLRGAVRVVTGGSTMHRDFESIDEARACFLAAGFTSAEPLPLDAVRDIAHLPFPSRVWELRTDAESAPARRVS